MFLGAVFHTFNTLKDKTHLCFPHLSTYYRLKCRKNACFQAKDINLENKYVYWLLLSNIPPDFNKLSIGYQHLRVKKDYAKQQNQKSYQHFDFFLHFLFNRMFHVKQSVFVKIIKNETHMKKFRGAQGRLYHSFSNIKKIFLI